jgi:hypothetical protein
MENTLIASQEDAAIVAAMARQALEDAECLGLEEDPLYLMLTDSGVQRRFWAPDVDPWDAFFAMATQGKAN